MHALITFSRTAVVVSIVQRTSLATHVFRLLRQADVDRRPVSWLLIENVGIRWLRWPLPLCLWMTVPHEDFIMDSGSSSQRRCRDKPALAEGMCWSKLTSIFYVTVDPKSQGSLPTNLLSAEVKVMCRSRPSSTGMTACRGTMESLLSLTLHSR